MSNKMALDALTAIAEMDPQGIRGDDLGRAARTARAAIAALQAEPTEAAQLRFLCKATRFKMSFDHKERVNCFYGHSAELDGRWVALVPAENDSHLAEAKHLQAEPQPMDTAPKDGTRFLAWYPKHRLDEDDCPTGEPIGGAWAITSNNGGMWDEPDFLSAAGAWFFDDWCFADEPTRWMHLPPDVDAALPATPPKD